MSDNVINIGVQLPKIIISEDALISKLFILKSLCQNETFHHKFKIRLLRLELCRFLETRRSHGLLRVVVPIREVGLITPPHIVGVRVRVVSLVIVHKVCILFGGSSCEDHLIMSIGMTINSAYLTVERGRGN